MPWLAFVKKPVALPLLRGTELAYEHLDPVEVLPDRFEPRSMGAYRHFVWVKISTTLETALAEAIKRDETTVLGVTNTIRKRAYTLDTATIDPKVLSTFTDREAESIVTDPKAVTTAVKLKAAKVIVVR